jgi:hypothetical protein
MRYLVEVQHHRPGNPGTSRSSHVLDAATDELAIAEACDLLAMHGRVVHAARVWEDGVVALEAGWS